MIVVCAALADALVMAHAGAVRPDLAMAALALLWSEGRGGPPGACGVGLLRDAFSISPPGLHALSFLVAWWVACRLRGTLKGNRVWMAACIAAGSAAAQLALSGLLLGRGIEGLRIACASAVLTAGLAAAIRVVPWGRRASVRQA